MVMRLLVALIQPALKILLVLSSPFFGYFDSPKPLFEMKNAVFCGHQITLDSLQKSVLLRHRALSIAGSILD